MAIVCPYMVNLIMHRARILGANDLAIKKRYITLLHVRYIIKSHINSIYNRQIW